MREARDPIGKVVFGVIYESEVPHMGPEIRVQQEEALEAGIKRSTHKIDGVEYVFLGREDEGTGGESAGGERRCGCVFKSGLVVRRDKKSDLVDDGVHACLDTGTYRSYRLLKGKVPRQSASMSRRLPNFTLLMFTKLMSHFCSHFSRQSDPPASDQQPP